MNGVNPDTRKGRILEILADHKWHPGIHEIFGNDYHTLSQRVGELGRDHGHEILTRPWRPPCKLCHANGCPKCGWTGYAKSRLREYRLVYRA